MEPGEASPAPAEDESTLHHVSPPPVSEKSQPHPPSNVKTHTSAPPPKSPGVTELKTIDQVAAFVEGMLGFEHLPFPSLIKDAVSSQPFDRNLTVATLK
jgi:hypothetical protein